MRRWRRYPGVILAPQVRARDDFTDADGTALESHRPTSEGSWTKHGASGEGSATIDGGRVHNTNDTTGHFYFHSWVPPTPDYAVECDVVVRSDNNLANSGVAARMDTVANTYYWALYNTISNAWQLTKVVAGTVTTLSTTVTQVLTVDQAYRLALDVRGNRITALVGGVPIITAADAAITAAGRAGVRLVAASDATTGIHIDSWRVRQ